MRNLPEQSIIQVFLLVIILSSNLFSQADSSEYLKELQSRYDSLSSFTCSFKQAVNGKFNMEGKIYFKKENNIRVELKNNVIITDGKTVWNYDTKNNKVLINNFDKDSPALINYKTFIYYYPKLSNSTDAKDIETRYIRMIPKEGVQLNFKVARVVLTYDNLIDRINLNMNDGSFVRLLFNRYKINLPLDDELFNFTPPAGTKVIDLR